MRLKDLTDQWLLKTHFFGVCKKDEVTGLYFVHDPQDLNVRLEPQVIQDAINESVARLEAQIGFSIRHKENIVEFHDYDKDLYKFYNSITLRSYPLVKVKSLQISYGESGSTIWDIPDAMIQKHGNRNKFGYLNTLPMFGLAANYDPTYAALFPYILNTAYSPSIIKVTYDAGLDGWTEVADGSVQLPGEIVRAIGILASTHIFNILGDIIIGAGIAAVSASVDGVSQSITTTASAENSAYSARIKMQWDELYGRAGQTGLMEAITREWRRPIVGLL